MTRLIAVLALVLATAGCGTPDTDDPLRVAVASNFAAVSNDLAAAFTDSTGIPIVTVSGATGVFDAQIRNGAPFHALLAADEAHPTGLERDGFALTGTCFTYAKGVLALWSASPDAAVEGGRLLKEPRVRVAVADPDLAPYGQAAMTAMSRLLTPSPTPPVIVTGRNVAQAFQFAATSNVAAAFVAGPMIRDAGGVAWTVPSDLHDPIVQQAILLRDDDRARAFLDFVRGPTGRALIADRGYGLPPVESAP